MQTTDATTPLPHSRGGPAVGMEGIRRKGRLGPQSASSVLLLPEVEGTQFTIQPEFLILSSFLSPHWQ